METNMRIFIGCACYCCKGAWTGMMGFIFFCNNTIKFDCKPCSTSSIFSED